MSVISLLQLAARAGIPRQREIRSNSPVVVAKAQAPTTQSKPNILFILVDNLGYGELGVYGGGATRGAPTPAHR